MNVEATIGIEKEFACISSIAGREHYILAGAHMLQMVQKTIDDIGWRIIPEYSGALLEVISPPVRAHRISDLMDNLEEINELMSSIKAHSANGKPIYLSDEHSVTLDKFLRMDGTFTRDITQIVIQEDDRADLRNLIATLAPAGFLEGELHDMALRFAGFTALNVTVSHPNWTIDTVLCNEKHRKIFGKWIFNRATEFRKEFGSDVKRTSEFNQLHDQYADWITMEFQQSLDLGQEDLIRHIYGDNLLRDWIFKEKTNYLVRPRIIGPVVGAEFRCFHSNITIDSLKQMMLLLTSEAKEIL